MRDHFGCIFKATKKYTMRVWWAFLYAYNGHFTIAPYVTSAAKKNLGHDPHGISHGHVRVYARLGRIKDTIHGSD
jgi:hypothetical protein